METVFSNVAGLQVEFYEIFKNTYFVKHLQTNGCFCSSRSARKTFFDNFKPAFTHTVLYIIFSSISKSYFRTLGIYAKTFAVILYYDISKFLVVYGVVLIAFTGSVYLAVNAEEKGLANAG